MHHDCSCADSFIASGAVCEDCDAVNVVGVLDGEFSVVVDVGVT